jgi:transposase
LIALPKKGSNQDWEHPEDPDAAITKMKDGRTHLAHKLEHAVDLKTGAVLAVTVQGANQGDTTTMAETLVSVTEQLEQLMGDGVSDRPIRDDWMSEIVADKGYHSNDTMVQLQGMGIRAYVSEPDRGRRNWKNKPAEQKAVYANRRRIRGERGKELLRRRGMLLERPFAHSLETGAMRRVHLRGRENILKRFLVHYAALNLGLVLRQNLGKGTPRRLQGLALVYFFALMLLYCAHIVPDKLRRRISSSYVFDMHLRFEAAAVSENPTSTTGSSP